MTVIVKTIISLIVAFIIASVYLSQTGVNGFQFEPSTFVFFAIATLLTTLINSFIKVSAASPAKKADSGSTPKAVPQGDRESGKVKWFNFSKGFGFISRDQGDDIFVHYRSIRGKGRRTLYEGQAVEFVVTEGEKGYQAEDVEIITKEN